MAHVLVAEEEGAIRHLVTEVLEQEGHHVTAPTDVDSALAVVRETPYPLIVVYHPLHVERVVQEERQLAALEGNMDVFRQHLYVAAGSHVGPLPPRLRAIEEQLTVTVLGDRAGAGPRCATRRSGAPRRCPHC